MHIDQILSQIQARLPSDEGNNVVELSTLLLKGLMELGRSGRACLRKLLWSDIGRMSNVY